MRRISAVSCALGVFLIGAGAASGQDSIALREIRDLRQVLEQQSKQIETLTQQVTKLNQALEAQKTSAPAAPQSAPAPATEPALAPPSGSVAEIRKAEPVAPSNKHVVAKGETLTSIAKQHNVGISELQKANKIENDRKLQIGQTLIIPPSKPPETSPEKPPNP